MALALCVLIAAIAAIANAATNVATVFNKNGQLTTSSTLVWQTFSGDEKQLAYAVHAGRIRLDAERTYPMYVCRGTIEGIYVTGHTDHHSGEKTVCVVSMMQEVRTHRAFDVLLNKGHGAKLTWKPWNKYDGKIPFGAVSAVSSGHVSRWGMMVFGWIGLDGSL